MCPENERLLDLLRLAHRELSSLLDQGPNLAITHPNRGDELSQLFASAREIHRKALDDYIEHITRHACGMAAEDPSLYRP